MSTRAIALVLILTTSAFAGCTGGDPDAGGTDELDIEMIMDFLNNSSIEIANYNYYNNSTTNTYFLNGTNSVPTLHSLNGVISPSESVTNIENYTELFFLVNLAQFEGATSPLDLDGANICVGIGSSVESSILDYYELHGMSMTTINTENAAAAQENFLDGSCGVWVGTIGALSQRLYGLRDEGMDLRLMTANLFWDYRWVEIYSVFDIEITQEEETAISFISVDAYTNLRAVCSINCTGIDADIELDVRYRTSTHSISCNNGEWQDESIRDEFSNYSAFRGEGLNCQHHFSYNASTYFSDLSDVDLDRYVLEWSDWHYFIVWEENTVIVES